MTQEKIFRGIWPVVPTAFDDAGEIDYDGMRNILRCMIDQGVDGGCILANYSEQFVLTDSERAKLTKFCLEEAKDELPLIVTISHFSTLVACDRAKMAKTLGATAVMMMAPYHGALLKGNNQQIYEQVKAVADVGLPVMIQDAPLSGVNLSAELLFKMSNEIEMVKMFKIESTAATQKLRELKALGAANSASPFDGEEGITLLADLDAGAVGSMTSALIPDLIKPIIYDYSIGRRESAAASYKDVLPIINFENRQCGFRATKAAMKFGKVIKSDFSRHPLQPLDENLTCDLLSLLKPFDPVILRWGK